MFQSAARSLPTEMEVNIYRRPDDVTSLRLQVRAEISVRLPVGNQQTLTAEGPKIP